jgi:hypothetical protein
MSIIGAIVAGLVGTVIISLMMMMGPKMGMPKMAIWEMLGSMFSADGNVGLGWAMHFVLGAIFGIIYAVLWNAGIGSVSILSGASFGIVHWLGAGLMMGGMPMMHTGIKEGTVSAPGAFMLSRGGLMGFMGGLIGHIIFGIVVALIYGLFV